MLAFFLQLSLARSVNKVMYVGVGVYVLDCLVLVQPAVSL